VSSLTRWVLAHKRTVVSVWVVLAVAGIAVAGPATDALKPGYSVPDKEGWQTNEAITARYGGTGGVTAPLIPVVTLPAGKTVAATGVRAELALIDHRLRQALPGSRIASFAFTGDRTFVSTDGRTTFVLAYPRPDPNSQWGEAPRAAKAASRALKGVTVAGSPVRLTGIDALSEASGADNAGTSVLVETLIGGFGALLVLIFVFASFLALVPLLMAFVSIMTCLWTPFRLPTAAPRRARACWRRFVRQRMRSVPTSGSAASRPRPRTSSTRFTAAFPS
jgi:putative drug exporter of the RND superfamily